MIKQDFTEKSTNKSSNALLCKRIHSSVTLLWFIKKTAYVMLQLHVCSLRVRSTCNKVVLTTPFVQDAISVYSH